MKRRRLTMPLLVALAIGVCGGTAFAYWRTTGSGSGTASTGTPAGVTVVQVSGGTPASKLIPGGSADLLLQVSNPNTFPVTLVGITQNGANSATGCSNAATTVSVPAQSGLSVAIPAGNNQSVHIPAGIAMTTGAASDCQGATLNVPVTITVQR